MPLIKIMWKPLSAFATELQSDTIFGHLCWGILDLYSEARLRQILDAVPNQKFELSSAFPKGCLPLPKLPLSPEITAKVRAKLNNMKESTWNAHQKRLKAAKWISAEQLINNNYRYSLEAELINIWHDQNAQSTNPIPAKEELIFHNTIDRTSSTSADLFAEEALFVAPDAVFESYLETELLTLDELDECFRFIEYTGFGRNKSTGKGYFKISVEEMQLPQAGQVNAYLALSHHVPAADDPVKAYYSGFTKFGKLGGSYAISDSPFKYPFYVLEPGTVYLGTNKPKGTILKGVHPDKPEIVQNLTTFSLPLFIEEEL